MSCFLKFLPLYLLCLFHTQRKARTSGLPLLLGLGVLPETCSPRGAEGRVPRKRRRGRRILTLSCDRISFHQPDVSPRVLLLCHPHKARFSPTTLVEPTPKHRKEGRSRTAKYSRVSALPNRSPFCLFTCVRIHLFCRVFALMHRK